MVERSSLDRSAVDRSAVRIFRWTGRGIHVGNKQFGSIHLVMYRSAVGTSAVYTFRWTGRW